MQLMGIASAQPILRTTSLCEQRRTSRSTHPARAVDTSRFFCFLRIKALPSSVIDLHPQSADVDFIAVKTRRAVTSSNRARAGIDQIVAADPRAVALRQPF